MTAVLLLAGMAIASAGLPPGGTFTDDDGNTHEGNIEAIAADGITQGCDSTGALYCPSGEVTRGQMASFISRALDLPAATSDYFTDDETSTHQDNINRLREAGVTLGCDASGVLYCPDASVSRAQMGSFLARALELPESTTDWFTDDDGNTHEANINRIADAAVTFGCDAATSLYCPDDPVLRDQMASFLARALGLDPIVPPPPTTTVPTTSPTTTSTTVVGSTGDLEITSANFDAAGNDNDNPNGEWVDIRNNESFAVDMTGWRLEDAGPDHTYSFPNGFTLAPGAMVRVFTGPGTDDASNLYWGQNSAVWNNSGDTASLYDGMGALVDSLTQ